MKAKQYIEEAKAVVFDMDGLLINSESIWRSARVMLLKAHGIRNPLENDSTTMGMGLKEAVTIYKDRYGFTQDISTLMKEYRQYVYSLIFENIATMLMPGAKELTQYLFAKKKLLGIATGGHTKEKVEEILDTLHLRSYFSVIVSCDDVVHGKPAPDVYYATAKGFGVTPKEIVVLEDAPNGVIAGKLAGMTVIGVNSDQAWSNKLYKAGANLVIESLKELL
jgi:HAD superfamily hydrolase (TIGR01509 family)